METGFNITVPNTSPQVSYFPFAEGDPTQGWDSFYLGSGFDTVPGEVGNGTSLQITRAEHAEVDISFYGTGIYIFGLAVQTAYVTLLDNVMSTGTLQADGIIASYTGLELDYHTVSLITNTTTSDSAFAFQRALITVETGLSGASLANTTYSASSSNVTFGGQWESVSNSSLGTNMQTTLLGDSATISFNGTSVYIYGTRSPNSGHYYVTLTGPDVVKTVTLDGETQWDVPDALLFWEGGLSQNGSYQVSISNADDGKALAVSSFVFTTALGGQPLNMNSSSTGSASEAPSSSSSSFPVGTAIAIALSVTAGIVLIFLVLLRQRKLMSRKRAPRVVPYNGPIRTYDPEARRPISSNEVDMFREITPFSSEESLETNKAPAPVPYPAPPNPRPPRLSQVSPLVLPGRLVSVSSKKTASSVSSVYPSSPRQMMRSPSSPVQPPRRSALAAVRTSMTSRPYRPFELVPTTPTESAGAQPARHQRSVSDALSDLRSTVSSVSSGGPPPSQHYVLSREMREARESAGSGGNAESRPRVRLLPDVPERT